MVENEIKLTNRGEYISEFDDAFIKEHKLTYLSSWEYEKYGCLQEYSLNEVCVGYNEKEQLWYGWKNDGTYIQCESKQRALDFVERKL